MIRIMMAIIGLLTANRDAVRHDATMLDRSGGTGPILSGATGSITATKPGTFD
jgi:hypothetical protein